jgi:hypothetical protein
VRRFTAAVLAVLALSAPLRAADPLAKYATVDIKACTTSIYIATVTMIMPPFVRRNAVYSSTYYAKVFPYFLFNERGRIWIAITDDELRRAEKGEPVSFTGRAINNKGDERRVDGNATPTGPRSGNIRVRVFVTRKISLTYDTTYELTGPDGPVEASRARPAR